MRCGRRFDNLINGGHTSTPAGELSRLLPGVFRDCRAFRIRWWMMPRFSARAADPEVVRGELAEYRCRTVADVDTHLRVLCPRMRILGDLNAMRKHLHDRDCLLDRRLVLMGKGST